MDEGDEMCAGHVVVEEGENMGDLLDLRPLCLPSDIAIFGRMITLAELFQLKLCVAASVSVHCAGSQESDWRRKKRKRSGDRITNESISGPEKLEPLLPTSMSFPVKEIQSKPFDGQKPGTSGLRKRCVSLQRPGAFRG